MVRPHKQRRIGHTPNATYFKPQGVPIRNLKECVLLAAETESLRLKYVEKLDQTNAAQEMGISQSTFQRILSSANQKIADAIINGHAIRIETE